MITHGLQVWLRRLRFGSLLKASDAGMIDVEYSYKSGSYMIDVEQLRMPGRCNLDSKHLLRILHAMVCNIYTVYIYCF